MDPLLCGPRRRSAAVPPEHPDLWQLYKQHTACFWTADEIDLALDLKDWYSLQPDERTFITHVLAFFAASDGIVMENINANFAEEVAAPEARAFYAIQNAMEGVHSITYSLLIDTYIADPDEKDAVFNAVQTMPAVRAKADWAASWMAQGRPFAQRLLAFACVEGVLFSGSFCAIFWLKKRGLMPGLTFSNELIARDEGLHTEFACALYRKLLRRLDDAEAHAIVAGAVEAERAFICDALSCDLIGMNSQLMTQYIRYVADRLLASLGHAKLFGAENPFDWMELISMQGKTNFFEKRVGEYQKANVMGDAAGRGFSLDADF